MTTYQLELFQGDTINLEIPLFDGAGGSAVLTSPTGEYTICTSLAGGAVPLLLKASGSPDVSFTKDSETNLWTMTVVLTSTDTLHLPIGKLVQQAQVGDNGNTFETVLSGDILVKKTLF